MLDERASVPVIAAAQVQIAVLGIGAVEQHGDHLPIGTDWIAAVEVARRVAEQLDALYVPALPFSMSECHGVMPGTVWLKPATLAAVLRDIVASLYEQGFRKIVFINAHGGNFVLEPVIEQLNRRFSGLRLILPDVYYDEEPPLFDLAGPDIHAGAIETSTQLYFNPQHVRPERQDCVPPVGQEFLDYVVMERLSPGGVWGNASQGDAAKGERFIAGLVEAVVHAVQQTFEVLDSC